MHKRFHRPHPALLASEMPRALTELQAFRCALPALRMLPRGDGHTVLVLPGFTADDPSTLMLRWFLQDRGYTPAPWNLGRNLGPTDHILDGMNALVERLTRGGDRISIVGWSLGGIYARELGREHPERIRTVITLGSPFRLSYAERDQTNAGAAFNALSPLHSDRAKEVPTSDDALPPMPIPVTNIYTRTDGVAPWRSCIDVKGDRAENVEVLGSHCGLGHNPLALAVIADRLAQRAGTWAPYETPLCLRGTVRVGPVPLAARVLAAA